MPWAVDEHDGLSTQACQPSFGINGFEAKFDDRTRSSTIACYVYVEMADRWQVATDSSATERRDLWWPLFPGSREQCDGELEPWFQNIWLQRYDGLARFAERSHHIDGRSCDCNRICRDDVHERGTIF